MDFAFFAANLGYTKADYEALTWTEIVFIKKAWEDHIVMNTQLNNTAHHVALINAGRKKGKPIIPVLKKVETRIVTAEKKVEYKAKIERIKEHSETKGKEWIKKIYRGRR